MKELDDFTVERLQAITQQPDSSTIFMYEVRALARIALAAKTAEHVAFRVGDRLFSSLYSAGCYSSEMKLKIEPLYLDAQPNSPELPDGWIPCAERMPAPGVAVLVYSPPQPGDYPGDVRIGFDFIDPDGDDPTFWHEHGENYEHFCCVAGGLEGCSGPSEKAPYTHWQALPVPPITEKQDGEKA